MLTALVLGTVGGLHCIGMCGPIVIALPQTIESGKTQYFIGRIIYNFGRVITYVILGLVFGAVGQVISLAGFQSLLSVTLGVIIIASLFLPFNKTINFINTSPIWRKTLGKLFQKKSFSALLGIGVLNGFLPCGLVYTALAGAVATGSSFEGGLFMFAFGAGTIPALLVVSVIGRVTRVNWQRLIKKALPATAFVLGCLLILRGLSLGIPYISPDLKNGGHHHHQMIMPEKTK